MQSVVLKIALLFLAGMSTHVSMSPPNPPASANEKAGKKDLFEHWVHWITWLTKTFLWVGVSVDALATVFVALLCSKAVPVDGWMPERPTICPSAAAVSNLTSVSATLIIGSVLGLSSALLRRMCYRALGHLFTFEITIRPQHVLVTTGPYSVVRHPSYVGLYGTLIGGTLVLIARGSFICEFGLRNLLSALSACYYQSTASPSYMACSAAALQGADAVQKIAVAGVVLWIGKVCFALSNVNKRLGSEDDELRKRFGEEWERYASTVRWWLIPGVV